MTKLNPLQPVAAFACPHCNLFFIERSDGTCINGEYFCGTCLEEEANDRYEAEKEIKELKLKITALEAEIVEWENTK